LIDKTRPIFFYHKLLLSLSHKLFSLFCRPVRINPQYKRPSFAVDCPMSDRTGLGLLIVAITPIKRNIPHNKAATFQTLDKCNL
ncbi:MAG: hypothetical protein V7K14_07750, partial [Nostoc sp.]|uniref:hypothetical protein n=1 Tax=Nostoc sp. TaxID=1180 RepID=UPI002FFC6610